MNTTPYIVVIVVNREYGERLSELPPNVPVWIVNTPSNRAAAERVWADRPGGSHLVGVTTFNCREGASPEQALVDEFDTIDLHHGTYSSEPPYTVVEVIGTQLSDTIRAELSEYGFDSCTCNHLEVAEDCPRTWKYAEAGFFTGDFAGEKFVTGEHTLRKGFTFELPTIARDLMELGERYFVLT